MPVAMQVKLFRKGFISLHIFAGIDETRAEVRQALATELPLECSTGAEARVSVALLLTAWEACRRQISVNDKNRAEAKLGVQRPFGSSHRVRRHARGGGKWPRMLGDKELPSKSLLAQKLEQVEDNAPRVEDLRDVQSTPPGLGFGSLWWTVFAGYLIMC